jgi:nucleotide-binding universal stress UspA family protein
MSENTIRKIVVGTDFNALATAAVRFASAIAGRTGAELIVVYADTFEPPAEFTAAQVRHVAETIEHSKRRTRQQLEAHVAKHVGEGVKWRSIVAEGAPATAISELAGAEQADFITLGTHGRGGLQRIVIGSVAEAVIRESRVPVLTVRSTDPPASIRRILCPVNATPTAAEAAHHAARMADALDAELTLLHVSTRGGAEEHCDIRQLVPDLVARATLLERVVEDDHPAPEILRIADSGEYDLIVVGAEHRLVRDVTLFGTTTASVTRHALAPVLTVTTRSVETERRTA